MKVLEMLAKAESFSKKNSPSPMEYGMWLISTGRWRRNNIRNRSRKGRGRK